MPSIDFTNGEAETILRAVRVIQRQRDNPDTDMRPILQEWLGVRSQDNVVLEAIRMKAAKATDHIEEWETPILGLSKEEAQLISLALTNTIREGHIWGASDLPRLKAIQERIDKVASI